MKLQLGCYIEEPHSPISNPDLTSIALSKEGLVKKAIEDNTMSVRQRMAEVEAALLAKWSYTKDWENYLDAPLLAHANATLSLMSMYDGIVGIESAGLPYSEIFKIMGFDTFSVDYSHHRRNMDKPSISGTQLEILKKKKSVLLVDVDIVTGKTISEVTRYLKENDVLVNGLYTGLSRWPGMDLDCPSINEDSINFDRLWKRCGNIRQLKIEFPYIEGILPPSLKMFTSSSDIDDNDRAGLRAARRVGQYLLQNENI